MNKPSPLPTISLIDTTQLPSSIIIDMVINKPPFPPYHIALLFLRLLSSSCIFFFLLLFSSCCVGRSRSLGQDFFTLQKLQTSSWILLTKLQILYFNMYVLVNFPNVISPTKCLCVSYFSHIGNIFS